MGENQKAPSGVCRSEAGESIYDLSGICLRQQKRKKVNGFCSQPEQERRADPDQRVADRLHPTPTSQVLAPSLFQGKSELVASIMYDS